MFHLGAGFSGLLTSSLVPWNRDISARSVGGPDHFTEYSWLAGLRSPIALIGVINRGRVYESAAPLQRQKVIHIGLVRIRAGPESGKSLAWMYGYVSHGCSMSILGPDHFILSAKVSDIGLDATRPGDHPTLRSPRRRPPAATSG